MGATSEHLADVSGFQTGASVAGHPPTVALSLQLRDGSEMGFAIPAEIAMGLAMELLQRLKTLDEQSPSATH